MSVPVLTEDLGFPNPAGATEEGLVAIGGDLSPQRLLCAYRQGIFPWPTPGYPLLWFSPDPRYALEPTQLHVSRSLRRTIGKGTFTVTSDTAFGRVVRACAQTPRATQDGTWITEEVIEGYCALHALGYAHSVEAWHNGELVGGVYGVALGKGFAGESMFATRDDASKVAFVALIGQLCAWDFEVVDCQVHTDHLARFGARAFSRPNFVDLWTRAVNQPTDPGPWTLDVDATEALAAIDRAQP